MRQQKVVPENYKKEKVKSDQGAQKKVLEYIDCYQSISMGNLITPLEKHYLMENMRNIMNHTMIQYINMITEYKVNVRPDRIHR